MNVSSSVEAAHFSDAVVSVSGSFTTSRRRSKWPDCVVRSKSARTPLARTSDACAASGAACPPARCTRPDASVSGVRGITLSGSCQRVRAHSRLRSPALSVGESQVEPRIGRGVLLDRAGRDDARVEHGGVEPVERDRARRHPELARRERHRRGQRRPGEAHRLRPDHRLVVERRRLRSAAPESRASRTATVPVAVGIALVGRRSPSSDASQG